MPIQQKSIQPGQDAPVSRDPVLLSAVSHASILVFFLIGPLTLLVPLVIWLSERNRLERSQLIEFHARQAFFYQAAVYLITLVAVAAVGILTLIYIGLLLIPFLILLFLAAIGYGTYGGIQVWHGREFRYKYLTDFIEKSR